MPVITVENLTKRYDSTTVVSGLNLSLRKGDIYGFFGRNGAGKKTTIRMLLGLVRPTKG